MIKSGYERNVQVPARAPKFLQPPCVRPSVLMRTRCAGANRRQRAALATVTGRELVALFTALSVCLVAGRAQAIRPFVTDDARVVGDRLAQLETWLLVDRLVLEHNILAAAGPTNWLEVTLGMTHGGVHSGPERGYSITGPILQAKALILPAENNGRPGFAIAAGVLPPAGSGAFTPPGWGGFTYAALTESLFDERLLLHANVGIAVGYKGSNTSDLGFESESARDWRILVTGGVGAQVRIFAGLHGVAEIYYGDPYDPRTNFPAVQAGFRYIFSDHVQVDGTFGSTLASVETADRRDETEQWGTLGLRLVSPELW